MRESREQARRRITANAEAIRRYVEMRERIHKGTAGSQFNLESDRKGESRVPLTAWAMRFLSDPKSSDARTALEPVLQDTAKNQPALYSTFRDVYADPGIIRRWEENDPERLRAYGMACRLVAVKLEARMPGVRIVVHVDPKDEPQPDKTTAYHHDRRVSQSESHRRRYERFKALEEQLGCSREAAKVEWSRREGMSVPTIERAINFCERKEGAA